MSGDCCDDRTPVPVLDKRIELGDTKGGNKFRRRCINCGHWLPMTSAAHFRSHPDPHVLPLDGDPTDLDDTIPLTEYDYGEEWDELAARVGGEQGNSTRSITSDGGSGQASSVPSDEGDEADLPDQNTERSDPGPQSTRSDDSDDESDDSDTAENRFKCPRCGAEHTGYPAGCDECEATYNW